MRERISTAAASNWSNRIQALRGVAICAVIFIHTNAGGLAGALIRPHVNFCVALFIFLSGYLTQLAYSDWKQFFARRIYRAIPHRVARGEKV